MKKIENIGISAKKAVKTVSNMSTREKNCILELVAKELIINKEEILKSNTIDIRNATVNNMKESLIDRLKLTESRIIQMAEGLRLIIQLDDPVGEIISGSVLYNNLEVCKRRVPLGVVAIIYESRPNVTVDAFGLCFKTGNVVILKGGKEAINTNAKIVEIIWNVLEKNNLPTSIVGFVEDTSRDATNYLMKMNKYIDVLIPRGGASLIKTVVDNSTIPIIETGTGNCHIYVDEFADIDKATKIVVNAKTQRVGVCNACESLVIHQCIAEVFIEKIMSLFKKYNVEVRGDEKSRMYCSEILLATDEDYYTEYLDLVISLKIVESLEDSIEHINEHNTKHSEAIITENYANARKFLNEIDASAVYVNASTRFTDGEVFGLGAEIGISTQKLHGRGPMGLNELTTYKYIIYGDGQIRE